MNLIRKITHLHPKLYDDYILALRGTYGLTLFALVENNLDIFSWMVSACEIVGCWFSRIIAGLIP